jgi:hypothetical protein
VARTPYLLHVLRVVEAVSDEAKVVAALLGLIEKWLQFKLQAIDHKGAG